MATTALARVSASSGAGVAASGGDCETLGGFGSAPSAAAGRLAPTTKLTANDTGSHERDLKIRWSLQATLYSLGQGKRFQSRCGARGQRPRTGGRSRCAAIVLQRSLGCRRLGRSTGNSRDERG